MLSKESYHSSLKVRCCSTQWIPDEEVVYPGRAKFEYLVGKSKPIKPEPIAAPSAVDSIPARMPREREFDSARLATESSLRMLGALQCLLGQETNVKVCGRTLTP